MKGVHPNLGLSPVKHRAPPEEMRIFHSLEGILDGGLPAIGSDDLLRGPRVVTGKEDRLAQRMVL